MPNHKELDNQTLRYNSLERNTIETRHACTCTCNAYLQLNYKVFSPLFYLHVEMWPEHYKVGIPLFVTTKSGIPTLYSNNLRKWLEQMMGRYLYSFQVKY